MNPRLAWTPSFEEPTPDKNARGNISYDYATSSVQPAILFALDTRRGRHVAITAKGWNIQPSDGGFVPGYVQQALPDPIPTDNPQLVLGWFQGLLRLDTTELDATWRTLVKWMLDALQPVARPGFRKYPILAMAGPSGSGRTVAGKLLAQLLDPTVEPLHSLPSTERRLHGLAADHHILAFDDTGKVGAKKSQLLSNLAAVRPIILTMGGSNDIASLADLTTEVELPHVEKPVSQHELWEEFAHQRARILGALFTLLSRNFNAAAQSAVSW